MCKIFRKSKNRYKNKIEKYCFGQTAAHQIQFRLASAPNCYISKLGVKLD